MVYRLFVEKKEGLNFEAQAILDEIRNLMGIKNLEALRLFNRYDIQGINQDTFEICKNTILADPASDISYEDLPQNDNPYIFAVELLPGQYDQRADFAAQAIQFTDENEAPIVRHAKVYMLSGNLSQDETGAIKDYIINPIESREVRLNTYKSLETHFDKPSSVKILDSFISLNQNELSNFLEEYSLAMDLDDISFCQEYFKKEGRNPSITEIKMIDTYWSDHCRHTTFLTTIDSIEIEDPNVKKAYDRYIKIRQELGRTKPVNLMDIATIAARYLKSKGLLPRLDESEEINACTVKIDVDVEGETEEWLLLFKNETHNHPTEIEPFGGAATCIGGAIRDPLSGRAYVYQAMRITGAANPLSPLSDTLEGKLSQRKIVRTAAEGNSSYGNQIGVAAGLVDEIYHDGYLAKHMELGAVVGAVPAENVRREVPTQGDKVILIGGKTGRDGCGGATGSSKSHTLSSLETCDAEVQKGNAPEERKLQRLFRNPVAAKMIKRCNDFGAGGVSVAIGELADGLFINLDAVPTKYEGLDGTELAISESQERMAVVLDSNDVDKFISLAEQENLEASVVAEVTAEKRLKMSWQNNIIVDISREFLNSNGVEKHIDVLVKNSDVKERALQGSLADKYKDLSENLNVCSKRGLAERFDSTACGGTVLMPFGGRYQRTPAQAMAAKIPVLHKETNTCSVMAWGYNPFITSANPYQGAYLAVIESVSKLVATGALLDDCYLSFQEYFERLEKESARWGKPFAALLGALDAQLDLGIASVGGKDSMSGSFEEIDVPPTLVSFAVTVSDSSNIISPEFKSDSSYLYLLSPEYLEKGTPEINTYKSNISLIRKLLKEERLLSIYTPTYGGVAEGLMKMSFGNEIGFELNDNVSDELLFNYSYGSFIIESAEKLDIGLPLGKTISDFSIKRGREVIDLKNLQSSYESKLEDVYPCNLENNNINIKSDLFKASSHAVAVVKTQRPKVFIPVFPGTNCEYEIEKAVTQAGGVPNTLILRNLTREDIKTSVTAFADAIRESQIIFIPGGSSAGDEPDGAGKFIAVFLRNPLLVEEINKLLNEREGLIACIGNGFQALLRLGLLPFGKFREPDSSSPTLTYNTILRHQSKIVQAKIISNMSPWLRKVQAGEIYSTAISQGQGRFVCSEELLQELMLKGQIASQYVDLDGKATMDIQFNPSGSDWAIEGLTSADGRIFGKMGHAERVGDMLYKNVPGNYDLALFESAMEYFK